MVSRPIHSFKKSSAERTCFFLCIFAIESVVWGILVFWIWWSTECNGSGEICWRNSFFEVWIENRRKRINLILACVGEDSCERWNDRTFSFYYNMDDFSIFMFYFFIDLLEVLGMLCSCCCLVYLILHFYLNIKLRKFILFYPFKSKSDI